MKESPPPIEELSDDEYLDFVWQMYWAVREESPLYEVPLGSIDRLRTGDVVHGPWRPSDCSRVLSRWHADGLLSLYRYREDGSIGDDLPTHDAAAMLADANRWTTKGDSWADLTALVTTERGDLLPAEEWLSRVVRSLE